MDPTQIAVWILVFWMVCVTVGAALLAATLLVGMTRAKKPAVPVLVDDGARIRGWKDENAP